MINQIFQSIILGLAQGLGEFLPISSSGHLVIIPWLFNFSDPGLAFDVALHAGTLIAVLAYFWKDIIEIVGLVFFNKYRVPNDGQIVNYNPKTLWFITIATIPGVLTGYFLEEQAETIFRQPLLVASVLAIAGWFLYLADKYMQHRKDMMGVTWKDSLIIGLSQAVAIIPGVSRSGATITAGLLMGLNRQSAARFSFLLSVPIIFGATGLKLPYLFRDGITISLIIGVIISAVSGYLAIKYLIKFVERTSYKVFFWYRLLLAIIICIVFWIKI